MLNIKTIRRIKSLSQDDLAIKTKISKRSIINYESGETSIPLDKLFRIAEVLGVHYTDLITKEKSDEVKEPNTTYRTNSQNDRIEELKEHNQNLTEYKDRLVAENDELKAKVKELEAKLAVHQSRIFNYDADPEEIIKKVNE